MSNEDFLKQHNEILELPPLKEIIRTYDIIATKKLGQNFLFDLNITDKIAKTAGSLDGKTVIEVGPGPGGLTRALLLNNAKKVIVIEHDEKCIAPLEDIKKIVGNRLEIISGDALKIKEEDIINDGDEVKIIANLPYNIGTELLFKWLNDIDKFESLTLMFQKEVAQRIVSAPKSKSYGVVSILAQSLCDCGIAFDLPPEVFSPAPKVTSSVVSIRKKSTPICDKSDLENLSKVTKTAFNQRRKMLRSSLKNIVSNPEELCNSSDISPTLRAEDLTVKDFLTLAKNLDS